MKRFVFCSAAAIEALAAELDDGLCHVFEDCTMPPGCSPERARIGFEKNTEGLWLFVDMGIVCPGSGGDFSALLRDGRLRFAGSGVQT